MLRIIIFLNLENLIHRNSEVFSSLFVTENIFTLERRKEIISYYSHESYSNIYIYIYIIQEDESKTLNLDFKVILVSPLTRKHRT